MFSAIFFSSENPAMKPWMFHELNDTTHPFPFAKNRKRAHVKARSQSNCSKQWD